MKKWILGLLGLCACVVLGLGNTSSQEAEDKKRDAEAALALFKKGNINELKKLCEAEVGLGCAFVGAYYFSQHNNTQAKIWSEKGCRLNEAMSCVVLGDYYHRAKNYAQALQLYTKSCDGGAMFACYSLANLFRNGLGVERNEKVALELDIVACNGGIENSCFYAGFAYEVGKDFAKARQFYKKGCELNNAESCFNLGAMYHNGKVVRQNWYEARELFGKACDLGYQDGCKNYKSYQVTTEVVR